MKQVAGGLRLDMAAFRELAAFALFASDLDQATQDQLGKGQRLQEILKQPQYQPVDLVNEVIAIFGATKGYADHVSVPDMQDWERGLIRYMETSHPELVSRIAENKAISDEDEGLLDEAIKAFNATWS
jgi:F-type H+-transporting ATPase subunit alpha